MRRRRRRSVGRFVDFAELSAAVEAEQPEFDWSLPYDRERVRFAQAVLVWRERVVELSGMDVLQYAQARRLWRRGELDSRDWWRDLERRGIV